MSSVIDSIEKILETTLLAAEEALSDLPSEAPKSAATASDAVDISLRDLSRSFDSLLSLEPSLSKEKIGAKKIFKDEVSEQSSTRSFSQIGKPRAHVDKPATVATKKTEPIRVCLANNKCMRCSKQPTFVNWNRCRRQPLSFPFDDARVLLKTDDCIFEDIRGKSLLLVRELKDEDVDYINNKIRKHAERVEHNSMVRTPETSFTYSATENIRTPSRRR